MKWNRAAYLKNGSPFLLFMYFFFKVDAPRALIIRERVFFSPKTLLRFGPGDIPLPLRVASSPLSRPNYPSPSLLLFSC